MPDLLEQLHDYADGLEACVPSVTADDAVAESTIRAWRRGRGARRSRRMWAISAAAAMLVVVVVAGQLQAGGPIPFGASSDDIALRDALVGRRFVVTSITQDGQEKELDGPAFNGEPAIGVLTFGRPGNPANWSWSPDDEAYMSFGVGCNATSGGFEVVDGRLRLVGDRVSTGMACTPEVMDLDQWLSQVLADAPTITLDGDRLTLATTRTTIELVERAEPPSPPALPLPTPLDPALLAGRTFVATGALVGGVERRIAGPAGEPEPHRLRITFRAETVTVSAGCNEGTNPYTIEKGRIDGLRITTERGCPVELAQQDEWLNGFFSTLPSISLDGDYLTLGNQIDTIMIFVDEAAESPAGAPSPFTETRWNLDGESVPGLPVSDPPTWEAYFIVTGEDEPDVYLRDGCTVVTGTAEVSATSATSGTITMRGLERTDGPCPPPLDQVAEVMTGIQAGEWSYAIDGDRLELHQRDRTVVFRTN